MTTTALPWPMWDLMNYTPNEWALEHVHTSTARFNTYCTCRQCGKTETLAMLIHEAATQPRDAFGYPMVGVLSYDYDHAELSIAKWRDRMNAAGIAYRQNLADHEIWLPWNGNATVKWMSAEQSPHAVAGRTWSRFFIDEAQAVPDKVYQTLRPGLDVRRSPLYSFGTPDTVPDQTWFEGLFRRGQLPDQPAYNSFTLTALQNKWMSLETIREAREESTEEAFRQLYLGQWVQLSNKVFRWQDVDEARRVPQLLAPKPNRVYVAGLDVGQARDYTVLYIMDAESKDIVFNWRTSRMDYTIAHSFITEVCKLFRVEIVMMENNGPGRPVRDHLRRAGVAVWDVDLGGKNKGRMLEALNADLQFRRIGIPEDEPQLPAELKGYIRKATPHGNLQYEAPVGFFDDCVIALMYAAEAARVNGVVHVDSYASWGSAGSLAEQGRRIA